jgi:hypothetical protein
VTCQHHIVTILLLAAADAGYHPGMPRPEICANCGDRFAKAKPAMRFCSRRCQREALARQDRAARALYRAALKILGADGARAPT